MSVGPPGCSELVEASHQLYGADDNQRRSLEMTVDDKVTIKGGHEKVVLEWGSERL